MRTNIRFRMLSFICIVVFLLCPIRSKALEYIGTLSYWYSDDSKVGKWANTNRAIGVITLNSQNTTFNPYFSDGMANAKIQWNNALGSSFSTVGYYSSSSSFNAYGGSRDEILAAAIGFSSSDLSPNTGGQTNIIGSIWGYFKHWPSGTYYVTKTAYNISSSVSCVLDKQYETNYGKKIKHTCLHEIGHAVGWFGHSSMYGDTMYPSVNVGLTISSEAEEHLVQIYQNGWY